MQLDEWIAAAHAQGASDLHLEPRLPITLRVRGELVSAGPAPAPEALTAGAKALLGAQGWREFVERGSADLSRTLAGVRCRINALRTARGVGFAVRLLPSEEPTLAALNLHPELQRFARAERGLVLVSGPTGCGKSSTMAALVQEINLRDARHVLTIEEPIEYAFRSRRALIRQRQVGRDTPSFEQGLRDALREDPDVLLVGEMRDPETMRLTLDAAETGHLVFATVHSSSTADALQRIITAFAPESREAVQAQLADALLGVVCQRLRFRSDVKIRVPECEVLRANGAVRNLVRNGEFFKLRGVLETGSGEGMWSFERYSRWLDERVDWTLPAAQPAPRAASVAEVDAIPEPAAESDLPPVARIAADAPSPKPEPRATDDEPEADDGPIVLHPTEESIQDILSELDEL
ncbi:MAG: PilT/PilU family type 4a pilus ATPase [Planctomycetota bacterium]